MIYEDPTAGETQMVPGSSMSLTCSPVGILKLSLDCDATNFTAQKIIKSSVDEGLILIRLTFNADDIAQRKLESQNMIIVRILVRQAPRAFVGSC